MLTIVYYISDYGYGHATRSVALIRFLMCHRPENLRLCLCSKKVMGFIKASLIEYEEFIVYREVSLDIGYFLKNESLEPDLNKLTDEYYRYIETFPTYMIEEVRFLQLFEATMVISDISPVPFIVANELKVTSIGISNFTWFTGYQQMLSPELLEPISIAYSKMDYFISLPGADEPSWGSQGQLLTGFYSREPDYEEARRLKDRLDPEGTKRIIFFALGMSIENDELSNWPLWDNYNCLFIVSSNMKVAHPNVIKIPQDYLESQNYVAISDLVITKPGWGIISEAICLQKPLLLIKRDLFVEDQNTIAALNELYTFKSMQWDQLRNLELTEDLFDKKTNHTEGITMSMSHLEQIGEFIYQILLEKSLKVK